MLCYNKTDASESIDVNKISASKESIVSYYWCFLKKGFKFQPCVFSGCNDVLVISMNISDIAILNIQGTDYRCVINGISKSEPVNLLQKANLSERHGTL